MSPIATLMKELISVKLQAHVKQDSLQNDILIDILTNTSLAASGNFSLANKS